MSETDIYVFKTPTGFVFVHSQCKHIFSQKHKQIAPLGNVRARNSIVSLTPYLASMASGMETPQVEIPAISEPPPQQYRDRNQPRTNQKSRRRVGVPIYA